MTAESDAFAIIHRVSPAGITVGVHPGASSGPAPPAPGLPGRRASVAGADQRAPDVDDPPVGVERQFVAVRVDIEMRQLAGSIHE